jgi:hypothetical protein
MLSLMEGCLLQEGGGGAVCCGRPFRLPSHGRRVVAAGVGGFACHGEACIRQDHVVGDSAGQLEIRVGDGAMRVAVADEGALDARRKFCAPNVGLVVFGEPYAAHTRFGGVGGA